jgi:hypothetical protein
MAIEKVIDIKIQGNADEAVGSLRSQLRAAQADVAELSAKFGATSQEAIQAAKRAGELKDQIGDAKALTDAFNPDAKFKALSSSLAGVAGGFAAVQGGMALFGAESAEVEKTLLKVQSAMALSAGLQQIGESVDSFKQLGAVIKSLNIVQVANNFIQTGSIALKKEDVIATAAQSTATVAATAATSAATTGMKLLRLAIIGTGIGALVVGLVALYQNFDKVKEAVLNFLPGLKSVGDFFGTIFNTVTDFVGATSDASRALDTMREAADKSLALNKKYLEQQGDQLDEFTKKKIEAKNKYLEALKDEGNSEKDRVELAKRLNRELAAADKEREDEKEKKAKEAKAKLDAIQKENQKDAIAAAKKEADALKAIADKKLADDMKSAQDALNIVTQLNQSYETPAQKENREYEEKKAVLEANNLSTELLTQKHLENLDGIKQTQKEKDDKDEAEWEAYVKATDEKNKKDELDREKALAEQKKAIQDAQLNLASGAVNFLKEVGGKNKAVQKAAIIAENAIGIAKMIIANNAANIGALATPQAIATSGAAAAPVIAMNNITTALGVATTIAATAKALSAVGGGGAGGGAPSMSGAGAGGGAAPQFNVVGNSGVNQLASVLATNEQTPVKTYVVAQDVTSGQSLDRNIIQNASLG